MRGFVKRLADNAFFIGIAGACSAIVIHLWLTKPDGILPTIALVFLTIAWISISTWVVRDVIGFDERRR